MKKTVWHYRYVCKKCGNNNSCMPEVCPQCGCDKLEYYEGEMIGTTQTGGVSNNHVPVKMKWIRTPKIWNPFNGYFKIHDDNLAGVKKLRAEIGEA